MLEDVNNFLIYPTIQRDLFFACLGACFGSFINVVALRSLQEKNWIWPPSSCSHCQHRLSPLDMMPILSWFLLNGKCRYCQEKISWQYPLVEFATAVAFVVIFRWFGVNFEGVGMVFFACVMIAVTVTDFKEKLIPHEITYPAMLIGLAYTALLLPVGMMFNNISQQGNALHHIDRGTDFPLLSALAGVGVSYILFDFLAFYGLKLYVMFYGDPGEHPIAHDEEEEDEEIDPHIDTTFDIKREPSLEEEFEVMGGGDAVLAAVIAAWLGLGKLAEVLFFGFMIGTLMGIVYLIMELAQRNELAARKRRAAIGATVGFLVLEAALFALWSLTNQGSSPAWFFQATPWLPIGLVAAFIGALLGLVTGGARLSKPFPFGPALAAGAFIAMFYEPLDRLKSTIGH